MAEKKNRFKQAMLRFYGINDQYEIEIRRKIILLNMIVTSGIIFVIPYILIAYAQDSYLLSLFDFIAAILMVLTLLYLRHTGDYELAAYFILCLVGALLIYVIGTGGIDNTGPLWSYTFPLLLLFLLGLKRGAIGFAIFLVIVLLMFFLPGSPLLMTSYSTDFKLRFITTQNVVFAFSFFTEWVRAKTHEKITGKTRELEKALKVISKMEEEWDRLQNKLAAAKKLEAIGTLAGGMAHEFNNQITIISGNVELLHLELGENRQIQRKLKAIKTASHHISTLTSQLLSFSRLQILQLEIININDLIKHNTYSLNQALGNKNELILDLEPRIWNINVDPGLMIQMIIEMIINAREAMPQGGKLTIKTENVSMETHPPLETKEGQYVCLTVRDTGTGMDRETTQKIFEPFFTTKRIGEGTGLGLSSAYGTAKQHNGWIDVDSTPGQGTTFKVYIPFSP
jgi:signal transduction histidine kinase